MSLADLVNVVITISSRAPQAIGFGKVLLAAYHTKYLDRVRSYSSIDGVEADGWVAGDAIHKAASAVFAQKPSVKTLKIGRRASAPAQSFKFTPTDTTQADVITFDIDGVEVSYTIPGSATVASIVAALKTLIDGLAIPGIVTVDHTTYLEIKNGGAALPGVVESAAGPFDLRFLGMTQIKAQFDAGGEQDFTLAAAAAAVVGSTPTFSCSSTIVVKINGGRSQTLTLTTAATLAAALNQLNAVLYDASAVANGSDISIVSDRLGTSASVQIVSVTDTVGVSGFSTGTTHGTGDCADMSAVTAAEVVAKLSTLTNGSASVDGAKVKLASATLGTGGSATVLSGGTANSTLGGDFASNVVNSGSSTSAGAAGALHTVTDEVGGTLFDQTADPGIAADLSAIRTADSDWYGLFLDSSSKAEVIAAQAWAEDRTVLFAATTRDSAALDPASTTDVLYLLKAADAFRTFGTYVEDALEYASGAWLSAVLCKVPGSATFAFKNLVGVTASALSDTQEGAVKAKNGNEYTTVKGLSFTLWGKLAGGEWVDVTLGIDKLTDDIQNRVVSLFANTDKVPFTDNGIGLVTGQVLAALRQSVKDAFLSDNPKPTCTAPAAGDVSPSDKSDRILPDVDFAATPAGAVHAAEITGRVTS